MTPLNDDIGKDDYKTRSRAGRCRLIMQGYSEQRGGEITGARCPAAAAGFILLDLFASLQLQLAQLSRLCGFRCYGDEIMEPKVTLAADRRVMAGLHL